MRLFLRILSYAILACSAFLIFYLKCRKDDVERSLNGKRTMRYPLYEEQMDKIVFYSRRNYGILYYMLIFGCLYSAFPIMLGVTYFWIAPQYLFLLPIDIVCAVLLFYHSFDKVEIDKQGVVYIYDFQHKNQPLIINKSNGVISQVTHRWRYVEWCSYFLCSKEERVLLFEVGTEWKRTSAQFLKQVLSQYGISDPYVLESETDSML